MSYLGFAMANSRALSFGFVLMMVSSFGQTYFIALYGADFRAAFSISDGGLGAIYAVGTVMSALTLPWIGPLIDKTPLPRYTLAVGVVLVLASLATASSVGPITLGLSFFLLRLSGQGLCVHTAMTATAKGFPSDAGKALGIIALGLALAQAIMPIAAVSLMHAVGWRWAWVLNASLVAIAIMLLFQRAPLSDGARSQGRLKPYAPTPIKLWKDRRFLLTLPIVLASPFITTGFFFHQARLSEEMHWSIAWVASWFVAYAVTQAVSLIAAGPILDRYRPLRVLPFFMIPQGCAMLALYASSSVWVTPIYLILTGVSSAVASILATALWMELYGPELLARIRSIVGAWSVVASGASPMLMGALLDTGVPLKVQALGCLVFIVLASLASARVPSLPKRTAL